MTIRLLLSANAGIEFVDGTTESIATVALPTVQTGLCGAEILVGFVFAFAFFGFFASFCRRQIFLQYQVELQSPQIFLCRGCLKRESRIGRRHRSALYQLRSSGVWLVGINRSPVGLAFSLGSMLFESTQKRSVKSELDLLLILALRRKGPSEWDFAHVWLRISTD